MKAETFANVPSELKDIEAPVGKNGLVQNYPPTPAEKLKHGK